MQPTLSRSEKPLYGFSGCGLVGVGLEGVEVLVGLGLSGRQARVYLALLRLGVAKARVVALLAKVPRQEVYGLLLELQQMGLVNQNLTVPISYSAAAFSETAKRLLEQKTREIVLISKRADRILEQLDQPSRIATTEASKPCFGEVYEGERGKKYRAAIEEAQHTIDVLVTWARFKQLCYHCQKHLLDALKRDIKINLITDKPANYNLPKWVNPTRQKYPNFKLKIPITTSESSIMIFDHTQLALAFDPNSRLTKGPDLWTSHPSLLSAHQTFFNSLWNKTENYPS